MKRALVIALALLSVACASVVLVNRCPGAQGRGRITDRITCPKPPAPEEEPK